MIAVRLILKVVFRTLFGWRVFMGLPLNLKMAQTASQCDDDVDDDCDDKEEGEDEDEGVDGHGDEEEDNGNHVQSDGHLRGALKSTDKFKFNTINISILHLNKVACFLFG